MSSVERDGTVWLGAVPSIIAESHCKGETMAFIEVVGAGVDGERVSTDAYEIEVLRICGRQVEYIGRLAECRSYTNEKGVAMKKLACLIMVLAIGFAFSGCGDKTDKTKTKTKTTEPDKTNTKTKTNTTPVPKPKPEPDPKTEPKPEPKPEPDPKPEPEPKPELKPEPKTEPKIMAGQVADTPEKNVRFWYQLVNVTIPSDSALRLLENIDKPPQVYIIFKKDGKYLGETTVHTGWTVDFPHKIDNQFPIRIRSDAVYAIEVWDDDTFGNENIFNITQIKGEEFAKPIYQKGGAFEDKKSLAYITWKKIQLRRNTEKRSLSRKAAERIIATWLFRKARSEAAGISIH